jgi:hypothetical protein
MIEMEPMPGGVLRLEGSKPLFRGHQRLVFQHPERPDLLIKTLRAEYVRGKFGPGSSLHNRHRRCREYQPFLLEFREYLVACARAPHCLPYLQEIVGLVWTDLGLGMIVRKVIGRDGASAPTLDRFLRLHGKLDPGRKRLLDECLRNLEESDVVMDDLNDCNLVLGVDTSGNERFVLIDGIGSSTLVPIKAFSVWANRWSKRRRIARLRAKVEAKEQGLLD